MIQTAQDGTKYIVRYADERQFPKGADLQTAARDSVIRYARHHGIDFTWSGCRDFRGEIWRDGVPLRVYYWRSTARVTS